MIKILSPPKIEDLYHLIAAVDNYPTTARNLVALAEEQNFPEEVIDFYSKFLPDETFVDTDDLLTRTEQVEMMELQAAPVEDFLADEED